MTEQSSAPALIPEKGIRALDVKAGRVSEGTECRHSQNHPCSIDGRRAQAGAWPDALSSRLLYRGGFFRAESAGTAHNARALVTAALADWRLLPVLDDAVICASELVTNAVRHAVRPVAGSVEDRRVSVGMRCWDQTALFVEVGDYDAAMPHLPDLPNGTDGMEDLLSLADGGRGLLMVQKLADRLWWRRAVHGGKVVFARFDLARYGVMR